MKPIVPVQISSGSFAFCRITMAAVVWASFGFKNIGILWVALVIFALSAMLRIRWAPLVALYRVTVDRFWPSATVMLDENAMFFAHLLATFLTSTCLALFYLVGPRVGWAAILVLAIAKTISASGFCPAAKLYTCVTSGGCCRLTRAGHD